MPPLRVMYFFRETNVKCVRKSCHSFSDSGINYKPSMKNVFKLLDFEQK